MSTRSGRGGGYLGTGGLSGVEDDWNRMTDCLGGAGTVRGLVPCITAVLMVDDGVGSLFSE